MDDDDDCDDEDLFVIQSPFTTLFGGFFSTAFALKEEAKRLEVSFSTERLESNVWEDMPD